MRLAMLCLAIVLIGGLTPGCGDNHLSRVDVGSVAPAAGSVAGGTAVVVTGRGFDEGAEVFFDGMAASEVVFWDDRTLWARTPAGSAGTVAVTVVNPAGGNGTLPDGYEYQAGLGLCHVDIGGGAQQPIVGPYRIAWTEPVDATSLEGNVTLRSVDGAEVPFDLEVDGDRTAVLVPRNSLHFWSAYTIHGSEGVRNAAEEPCAAGVVVFSTVAPTLGPRGLRPAPARGLAIAGAHALIASPDYRGLQVYDLADPGAPVLVADYLTDEEPLGVVISGSRAYLPAGFEGVVMLDVSDPTAPTWLGVAGTPGHASDLVAFDQGTRSYLAVADGVEGVRLVDVTDPLGPGDLGAIDPSGTRSAEVGAVSLSGTMLAIANGEQGFALATVADVASPALLSVSPTNRPVVDVLLDGTVLYTSHGYYGLATWDVSTPAAPVLVDHSDGPNGPCGFNCRDFLGDMRRLGDHLFVTSDRTGILRFARASDGGTTLEATFRVPGHPFVLAEAGGVLLAGTEAGLLSYDPAGSDGDEPLWFDPLGHGVARAVALDGDTAYVAAATRGLETFSLADPALPVLLDQKDSPGSLDADLSAMSVEVAAGSVVLGDGRYGVVVYATEGSEELEQGGSLDAADLILGMHLSGTTLYACDGNSGVIVADVSDPSAPVELGRLFFEDLLGLDLCFDVAVQAGLLYVAGGEGLNIADVSDPRNPVWIGAFTLPAGDSFLSLALVADKLLTATDVVDWEGTFGRTRRLQVFDVSDPATPVRISVSEDLGIAREIAVAGDVAFVAAGRFGVHVFDVSDPSTPQLQGTIETPGSVVGVRAGTEHVYVVQGGGGLQAIATGRLPASGVDP